MRKVVLVAVVVAIALVVFWLLRKGAAGMKWGGAAIDQAPADLGAVPLGGKVKPTAGATATSLPSQLSPAEPTTATELDAPTYVPGTLTGVPEYQEPIRSDFTPAELAATHEAEYQAAGGAESVSGEVAY